LVKNADDVSLALMTPRFSGGRGGGEAAEAVQAKAEAATRPSSASGRHSEEQQQAILQHMNAEFARSKKGRWRRLFPSGRSGEYLQLFEKHQTCHTLPFDV